MESGRAFLGRAGPQPGVARLLQPLLALAIAQQSVVADFHKAPGKSTTQIRPKNNKRQTNNDRPPRSVINHSLRSLIQKRADTQEASVSSLHFEMNPISIEDFCCIAR
jgi:hypothetical protein